MAFDDEMEANPCFFFTRAFEQISINRTFIMSKNVFIGSGEHTAKYLGEYKADWYNLKRSIVAMLDMTLFGFPMVNGLLIYTKMVFFLTLSIFVCQRRVAIFVAHSANSIMSCA
jgi:hypothetical protein